MTPGIVAVRARFERAEDISLIPGRQPPPMTEDELDRILTFRWPIVMRRVMGDSSDEWLQGFVRSIAKNGKRASWFPTAKQQQLMRRLVSELGTTAEHNVEVIEGD